RALATVWQTGCSNQEVTVTDHDRCCGWSSTQLRLGRQRADSAGHSTGTRNCSAVSDSGMTSTSFGTTPTHKAATSIEQPPSRTAFIGLLFRTVFIKLPSPKDARI